MSFLSFLLFYFLPHGNNGRKCGNQKTQPGSTVLAGLVQKRLPPATIEKLPVEVQQHIASFLTPESAACLTLCSKSLQRVVGQQSWFALRTTDQKKARLSFLMALQRDLRDWLLCYHCEKLHPFDLKPYPYTPWPFRYEHPCFHADGLLDLLPSFALRFSYVHMIMKLHQQHATENIFLESLSHALSSVHNHHVSHSHTSARITNSNLLVKLELRILLRHGEDFGQIRGLCRNVCPHWRAVVDDNNLAKIIRCQMSHGTGQSCPHCTRMVQCQRYSTEFIVAFLNSN